VSALDHDQAGGATCPACGSVEVSWAAPLGSVLWACCRHCGMEYRRPLAADDEEEFS
jgi:ribosomal protein L37AE/L43A